MERLAGKVALVTGAASGIGKAAAQALVREGAGVAVADINFAQAEAVAQQLRDAGGDALAVAVDLRVEDQVRRAVETTVEHFGGLDVLCNNAADTSVELTSRDLGVTTMEIDTWDRTMEVNLRGTMLFCKHAIPELVRRGGGSIVNVSSIASLTGDVIFSAYSASKAGVNALTRSVAAQFGTFGVRCNAIAPHATLSAGAINNMTEAVRDMFLRHSATPYLGEPAMQADVIVFLASDESRYMTGQILVVDGGATAHHPAFADLYDKARTGIEAGDITALSKARSR
jgi:NAD(P)-dependent dehydrogenase (short-subunit alcohol dehydrogenase family)